METLTQTMESKVNEILTTNGLDFTIEKQSLIGLDGRPTKYFGLFNSKTNECVHTCKESYTISQNKELVEMVLLGMSPFGNDLKVQKGGALEGGRKVYLQLEISGHSMVGNDVIKKYITILDSNDGSTSLSIGIGDLTMSCQNQFWKFYKRGQNKFKHNSTIESKIKGIPNLIELALETSIRQIELYNKFVSTPITRDLANKFVTDLLGFDKITTRSMRITDNVMSHMDKELSGKGLNVWGLHSGITSYTTHAIGIRKTSNRIEGGIIGNGYKMNQKSLAFATSLIG